ncbi:MAG: hypothetical protein EBT63_06035, partial [Proteobacteria bacterium]|nr:hypothetical protein [Pseudomonadota bacterium]
PVGPGPLPQEFPPQTTMQDLLQKHAGVNLGSQSSDSQSSGSQSPAMQSSGPVDTGISDELSRLTLVVGSNQGNDSGDEGWGGRSGDGRSEDGTRSSREARSPSPQAAASHSGARSPSPQVVNPSPGASSDPSQRQV